MSRTASLRRQLDLMAEIRDRAYMESAHDFEQWMDALSPLTTKLIDELHKSESTDLGVPYNPWHGIHGAEVAWGET